MNVLSIVTSSLDIQQLVFGHSEAVARRYYQMSSNRIQHSSVELAFIAGVSGHSAPVERRSYSAAGQAWRK